MPYRLKGILKLPNSAQVAAGVDIEFISRRNYSPLLMDLSSIIKTSPTGAYDITLEYGEYAVVLYWGCNQPSHIGKLFVFADTGEGLDLQTLLQQADWQPATPEYVQQIQGWLAESLAAANQATDSAEAAKASELLVEADRAEVASNKTIVVSAQEDVTTKHADVVEKAAQVAANTAIVNEKVPLAIAAADTASQKAVESSEGAATATDAAIRAENAALAMVGAILDGGQCDLSSGFYPPALTVNGKKYSTVWYVQTGGTVAGTKYDSGDKLQYTTANDGFYFRIDARDDVVSVNGEKGAVVLTAQKVGADASGTAADIMSQHKSESSAHAPQDVGADPAGTAAGSTLAHAQKEGAHPISGVDGLQSIIDAIASSMGAPNLVVNPDLNAPVNQRAFDGNWSALSIGAYGYDQWIKTSNTHMGFVIEDGKYIPSKMHTLTVNNVVIKQIMSPASGHFVVAIPFATSGVYDFYVGEFKRPWHPQEDAMNSCKWFYQVGDATVEYLTSVYLESAPFQSRGVVHLSRHARKLVTPTASDTAWFSVSKNAWVAGDITLLMRSNDTLRINLSAPDANGTRYQSVIVRFGYVVDASILWAELSNNVIIAK